MTEGNASWTVSSLLARVPTVEADVVQGTTGTGFRGTLEQRLELGGRERDQPVWLLVLGTIRRRLLNDQARP
jgi:hypothetical protein